MINKNAISLMKEGVVILNFARDVLVNSEDIVDALVGGKVGRYVTDFPTSEIAGVKHAIVIPHLGASTAESEDNCAKMAVEELKDFLENGNIRNSVNFPACDMGVRDKTRITILHRNIPNMIGQFTTLFGEADINIAKMLNKSKGNYAYSLFDLENHPSEAVLESLEKNRRRLKSPYLKVKSKRLRHAAFWRFVGLTKKKIYRKKLESESKYGKIMTAAERKFRAK